MKKLLTSLLLVSQVAIAEEPTQVIMVIADGMGPEYTTAYRYFKDDKSTPEVERTIFDKYLLGSASTYPAPVSGYVTDSAAAATALSTGVKSYNGAIAVDVNKKPIETVLERAKAIGLKTGAVVTSQINHATPASFIAHNEYRRNYNEIADSYADDRINNQYKFDILLGGGWQYFLRDDRNIIDEMKADGFQYIDQYDDLSSLDTKNPAIGLFADTGLPFAIDDTNKYRLSLMTEQALRILKNDKGYFLLVEASQVDWAGHSNDIASAMSEMDDLAKTMEYLESYVQQHPNTTVLLTADHSTGGMTLGLNGKYEWNPEILKTLRHTPVFFAKHFVQNELTEKAANKLLSFELTNKELTKLQQAKSDGQTKLNDYLALSKEKQKKNRKPSVAYTIEKAMKAIIDVRTNTGWTTSGHIAIDVPVIALGKNRQIFAGSQDNTDLAKKLFKQLLTN
ncbi:alkaline phosphatase [Thalassotalea atypica]|uniref:alkaline phosphatase n=1 Tax=Thalassotalea atypica TaxID=2054316 RepID=UPI0025724FB5|nr:alkaline phosphatase [Thalassotalea atypica]